MTTPAFVVILRRESALKVVVGMGYTADAARADAGQWAGGYIDELDVVPCTPELVKALREWRTVRCVLDANGVATVPPSSQTPYGPVK